MSTDKPLPISVELAKEIRSARASATIPEVADEMLGRLVERIIDARVRPLVEALQGLRRGECFCGVGIDNPMMGGTHSKGCDAARAALRAAGAE